MVGNMHLVTVIRLIVVMIFSCGVLVIGAYTIGYKRGLEKGKKDEQRLVSKFGRRTWTDENVSHY